MDITSVSYFIIAHQISNLITELSVLRNTSMCQDSFPVVMHGIDHIQVFGGERFRAYIPKKYQGWRVEFIAVGPDWAPF
jgi:hypothetical protein